MGDPLSRHFGHPRGVLGWLAGQIMALENRERNRWAVGLLDLRPDNQVLEIGFGPGLAIAEAATQAGFVAGVDSSDVMVRMARKRNAVAVAAGRVELRLGSAEALPFADGSFDVAFAVNSLQHWDRIGPAIRELHRVLRAGGRVAIVHQPHGGADDATLAALTEPTARTLAEHGFDGIGVLLRRRGKPSFAVLAHRTADREASPGSGCPAGRADRRGSHVPLLLAGVPEGLQAEPGEASLVGR